MVDTVWVVCKDNQVKSVFDSTEKARVCIVEKNDAGYFFNTNRSCQFISYSLITSLSSGSFVDNVLVNLL